MRVEKSSDKRYPYIISDGWGGKIYCTTDDLKELKNTINKILREEKAKNQK